MFERFDEIYKNWHDYAREWKKKTGRKIIGYFCTYLSLARSLNPEKRKEF